MKQPITLVLQYYKLLLLYNIAFTIAGTFLTYMTAGHFDAHVFLFGKIVGFAAAIALYHFSAKPSYFYFYNTGYRLRKISAFAFMLDIAVYIIIVIAIQLISLCSHLF